MDRHTRTRTRLFHRGGHTLAVLLAVLLAVGPVSAVMPRIVAVVGPNSLPMSEEEAGHEDHKANRFVRPPVGPPLVPVSVRPGARLRVADRPSRLVSPQRHFHSAHGLDGPHLRC